MGKSYRWIAMILIAFVLLGMTNLKVQGVENSSVVLNEIMPGVEKSIELSNPSPSVISLEGYTLSVYHMGSTKAVDYEFPAGASIPAYDYVVFHISTGSDTASDYYLETPVSVLWNNGGAVELYNATYSAIDFVRFNGSVKLPPTGTHWTGVTPAISDNENSLGRNSLSIDTDDGSDWVEQDPTLGYGNEGQVCYPLTIGKTGNGMIPADNPGNSDGCFPGQYVIGEVIALSDAIPDEGWGIIGWNGTDYDDLWLSNNTVTMPSAPHSVTVNYSLKPSQVDLISPADYSNNSQSRLTFEWEDVPEADRYIFEVVRSFDNTVMAKYKYASATRCFDGVCSIPSPVTLDLGEYKWHVRATDQGLKGDWSEFYNLTITLDQPILRSPGIDATVYGGRPTYKWYEVQNAASYIIEFYDATGSSDVLIGQWQKNVTCDPYCAFRIPSTVGLTTGYGDYRWRVYAKWGEAESEWSQLRTFTYTQLDRTSQINPSENHITSDTSPIFEWTEINGATYYVFQVRYLDDIVVANELVKDETYCIEGTCAWELPEGFLNEGETYKWHVRAKNGRNYGRWTPYLEISIIE